MSRFVFLPLLLVSLSFVTTTTAFSTLPNKVTSMRRSQSLLSTPQKSGIEEEIDIDRAKDCAEHFGKCSIKEVQRLRNELHKERVRNFALNNAEPVDHYLFEEELNAQLSHLAKINNQFPEVEEPMAELPHLKDGTLQAKVKKEEIELLQNSFFMEENVLETIAFCSIIGLLILFNTPLL